MDCARIIQILLLAFICSLTAEFLSRGTESQGFVPRSVYSIYASYFTFSSIMSSGIENPFNNSGSVIF